MIDFTLNGRAARSAAVPTVLLITVLRDELHLTGTKLGCDDGRCGACTVLVDGRLARACQIAVGEIAGSAVLTVEGLGTPEILDPLQRAFVETGAIQCGFCTPGMLHLKVVRSPHAHARVRGVDAADALALPGVAAVLTAKDVPVNRHGWVIQDQAVLAGERVRMIGDPVAAVVAETEALAGEAAGRVRVSYEVLPAVTSPREALEPGAPRLHDGGNLLHHQVIQQGDAETALARAPVKVEGYSTPPLTSTPTWSQRLGLLT